MLVKDAMTKEVVTITSNTPVLEAERILQSSNFERLPVVDDGKLVGIVTKDTLLKASPSVATSLSRGELFYLLSKLLVKDIMKKRLVTVTPEMTIEQATAIAQHHRVGALPVVEGERLVGILTTNDIFYKVLNPLLGIGEEGKRFIVYGAGDKESIKNVLDVLIDMDVSVKTLWTVKRPGEEKKDLIVHVNAVDITDVLKRLDALGFSAEERKFSPQ